MTMSARVEMDRVDPAISNQLLSLITNNLIIIDNDSSRYVSNSVLIKKFQKIARHIFYRHFLTLSTL